MGRACYWGSVAAVLLAGCGSSGQRDGPALYPRPETQTCLPDASAEMPELLSGTGCFSDLETLEPAPELVPYDVNSALWTDGAYKLRFMVIPNPERILIRDDGSWSFPDGSILIKVFGLEFDVGDSQSRRPIETRFMVRRDGGWEFFTYKWNDDGTDGELLAETQVVEYVIANHGEQASLSYRFPDRQLCTTCHGSGIGRVLGPRTDQLNRNHDYDGLIENQLVAMNAIGLFEGDVEIDPTLLPAMASPQQGTGTLEEQARAYLDVNCAHCHQPGGWIPAVGLDLRYDTATIDAGFCDVPMMFGRWTGIPRISPGDPDGSGLLQRFTLTNVFRMPSVGTSTVDQEGVDLLASWVRNLPVCP